MFVCVAAVVVQGSILAFTKDSRTFHILLIGIAVCFLAGAIAAACLACTAQNKNKKNENRHTAADCDDENPQSKKDIIKNKSNLSFEIDEKDIAEAIDTYLPADQSDWTCLSKHRANCI